ncbi:LacI family DNA-binding transcriptional regulator [uncultured Limosilactobacillus sp.]|uniref:LacI family DNA-binding transcriptional regulator n=1 Tax=uncultured Limosilactobacillus sp. TaxID=2837629 RepID=UPI0025D20614|nr:LacI family DNA-binding transcriptional regulator [uncultured Limosilactobacillus sp.]
MVTIKEIAQRAGYSSATVSRLLNSDPHLVISDRARDKILAVADVLGYWEEHDRPLGNKTIAVLFRITKKEQENDVYFATLQEHLRQAFHKRQLRIKMYSDTEKLINQAQQFEGFICVGANHLTADELTRLHQALPIGVIVDTNPAPHYFDSVQPNLPLTVRNAFEAMVSSGYHQIGFIGGQGLQIGDRPLMADSRTAAFKIVAEEYGTPDAPIFASGRFTIENGKRMGEEIIERYGRNGLPDGFICASDTITVGVLQAFNHSGVIVPRDTAIISINNSALAKYVSPPLTTYEIDQSEMCRIAVDDLHDLINHPKRPHVHLLVDTRLVVRNSFIPHNNQ